MSTRSFQISRPNPAVGQVTRVLSPDPASVVNLVECLLNPFDLNSGFCIGLSSLEGALVAILQQPTKAVPSLEELQKLLQKRFSLAPPVETLLHVGARLERLGILVGPVEAVPNGDVEALIGALARLTTTVREMVWDRATQTLVDRLGAWRDERPYYGEKLAQVSLNSPRPASFRFASSRAVFLRTTSRDCCPIPTESWPAAGTTAPTRSMTIWGPRAPLRFSLQFYNTEEEVRHIRQSLASVLKFATT